jgi:hypothetical protein
MYEDGRQPSTYETIKIGTIRFLYLFHGSVAVHLDQQYLKFQLHMYQAVMNYHL